MIPLRQFVEERIDALNQLDEQIQRIRRSTPQWPPGLETELRPLLDSLQTARDLADRHLFKLYSMRSAEWATDEVIASTKSAWEELRQLWQDVSRQCHPHLPGGIMAVSLLPEKSIP